MVRAGVKTDLYLVRQKPNLALSSSHPFHLGTPEAEAMEEAAAGLLLYEKSTHGPVPECSESNDGAQLCRSTLTRSMRRRCV